MRWEEWWEVTENRADGMMEEDSMMWRDQARGKDGLVESSGTQTLESAWPFLHSMAQASHLPFLGLSFHICKMGIMIVSTSLGGCED